ncbi:MAG TPA: 5'/3'-nucleotidase SurE [Kofleriaceae bacterium]|nr:5'/3'-nucleotidase SurE [Kofleriaceae bacterium]
MRILVSNDDGIYSPGIAILAEVASEFGTVRVVAPDVERSSAGHSITASRPLSYRQTNLPGLQGVKDLTAYRVNGTPADCVALGAHLWDKVDVVLSGLNIGLNLGNSTWHSGTLAAAKQAALLGLRGFAMSAPSGMEPDYQPYKPWIRKVLKILLADTSMRLANVNFPRQPRGVVWTKTSVRLYDGRIVPTKDPLGRELYWFTVKPIEGAEEGTDRWAVEQGWISLTPLRLDLTDEATLADLRARIPLDEAVAAAISPPRSSPADVKTVREDEDEAAAPLDESASSDEASPSGAVAATAEGSGRIRTAR